MDDYLALPGRYCGIYYRLCKALEPARALYRGLVEESMGYSRRRELEAASMAASRVGREPCRVLAALVESIEGARVCVLGPLAEDTPGGCETVVVVDSLAAMGISGDVVVGDFDSVARAWPGSLGSIILAHLHGDNVERLLSESWIRGEGVVLTSQAFCVWPILGVGGFTDGDRAVVISLALGAREVEVHGFDFSRVACSWKTTCFPELKRRKLSLASRIISKAAELYNYSIGVLNEVIFLRRRD